MWVLPGPGIEPVSPALTGGFLTTAPPGKPLANILKVGRLETGSHQKENCSGMTMARIRVRIVRRERRNNEILQ